MVSAFMSAIIMVMTGGARAAGEAVGLGGRWTGSKGERVRDGDGARLGEKSCKRRRRLG
jgi:hypothetical protein